MGRAYPGTFLPNRINVTGRLAEWYERKGQQKQASAAEPDPNNKVAHPMWDVGSGTLERKMDETVERTRNPGPQVQPNLLNAPVSVTVGGRRVSGRIIQAKNDSVIVQTENGMRLKSALSFIDFE